MITPRSIGASTLVVAGCLALAAPSRPGAPASRPFGKARTAVSRHGVVAAGTPEAARAGADVLSAGGNAVDAAVATALALAVTLPQAGNLAGGGFLVARDARGEVHALDFRETAPAGTHARSFLRPDGTPRGDASLTSGLAVATPGSVRGLEEAQRRLGRLPWSTVVAPALALARDGFAVHEGLSRALEREREVFASHPESRRVFFPGGRALRPGALLVQPELAATLEAIAREGADAFHTGPVAERIAAFVRAEGGVLTAQDLAAYRPVWRAPHVVEFETWRLATMPLPGSGGFLLTSVLGQLEGAPASWREVDSPGGAHVLLEAERRAFADRNRELGDPDCASVRLEALLAPPRLRRLAASIDPERATPSASVAPEEREREETTHVSVATAEGDAAALTTTLNGSFGNGSLVPGVGVLLNNEMDDFATVPGRPNLFGLVQGESNAVRAGGRPLSSMTPTIVLESGRLRFVLGSPGGSTIPTTVLQVFLRAGPAGAPLADAVEARRLHHQHVPDRVDVERGALPAPFAAVLLRRGHVLHERTPIGLVHAVEVRSDGTLVAVADPRGYGAAAGADAARPPGR